MEATARDSVCRASPLFNTSVVSARKPLSSIQSRLWTVRSMRPISRMASDSALWRGVPHCSIRSRLLSRGPSERGRFLAQQGSYKSYLERPAGRPGKHWDCGASGLPEMPVRRRCGSCRGLSSGCRLKISRSIPRTGSSKPCDCISKANSIKLHFVTQRFSKPSPITSTPCICWVSSAINRGARPRLSKFKPH